jgi:uncharacterized protein YciI
VLIAVVFTRGVNWDDSRPLSEQAGLEGHINFIRTSRDDGVVIQGGPFHDIDSQVRDELVGLALLDLDSIGDARALIDTDPIVANGVYGYRLYSWGGTTPLCR